MHDYYGIFMIHAGDPGTAKSQLLKFVEKVAPIGVCDHSAHYHSAQYTQLTVQLHMNIPFKMHAFM